MMDLADKLWKKQPFIYYIGEKYFSIGSGVCAECNPERFPTLKQRYSDYIDALDSELSGSEAWRIFHRVKFMAEPYLDEQKVFSAAELKARLDQFGFSDRDQFELYNQLEKFEDFWQKYHLVRYCR